MSCIQRHYVLNLNIKSKNILKINSILSKTITYSVDRLSIAADHTKYSSARLELEYKTTHAISLLSQKKEELDTFDKNYNKKLDKLNIQIGELRDHLVSLSTLSDTFIGKKVSVNYFNTVIKDLRDKLDENAQAWADNSSLISKLTGESVSMSNVLDKKVEIKSAELQNFKSSTGMYVKENNLDTLLLTATIDSEYQKSEDKEYSFYDQCNYAADQAADLRHFMRTIYDDRLTKNGKLGKWFWLRMLEFTKQYNYHLHEAIYINPDHVVPFISLAFKKWRMNEKIGRTHIVMSQNQFDNLRDSGLFKTKRLNSKDDRSVEYLIDLDDLDGDTYFDKFLTKGSGGRGFIIRILTLKNDVKASDAAMSYVMKYVLKTLNPKGERDAEKRADNDLAYAISTVLNIRTFSYKRGVLFGLTKLRKFKKSFLNYGLINDFNKTHSLYSLKRSLDNNEFKITSALTVDDDDNIVEDDKIFKIDIFDKKSCDLVLDFTSDDCYLKYFNSRFDDENFHVIDTVSEYELFSNDLNDVSNLKSDRDFYYADDNVKYLFKYKEFQESFLAICSFGKYFIMSKETYIEDLYDFSENHLRDQNVSAFTKYKGDNGKTCVNVKTCNLDYESFIYMSGVYKHRDDYKAYKNIEDCAYVYDDSYSTHTAKIFFKGQKLFDL